MDAKTMGEMSFKLDEVVDEIDQMHLVALQHAAEISPYVTERTLGADLPSWDDREQQKEKNDIPAQGKCGMKINENELKSDAPEMQNNQQTPKSAVNRERTNVKSEKSLMKITPTAATQPKTLFLSISNNLDYQAINTSVILRAAEKRRQKDVRMEMLTRQERQLATQRRSLDHDREKREARSKWFEQKRRSDLQLLQHAEQLTSQESQQQAQKFELLRKQTEQQLQLIAFQGVSQYQHIFRGKYEIIAKLLMSIDKQALLACGEYNMTLKELVQTFEQLLGKLKSGECGSSELKTAENLCRSLQALEGSIITELENIVKKEQQRTDALKEQQQQEEKNKLEQIKADTAIAAQSVASEISTTAHTLVDTTTVSNPTPNPASATLTDSGSRTENSFQFVNAERYQFYTQINNFYQQKVDGVKPLQTDDTMKQFRFACQKAINIPINAISAVTPQHLQDKFDKLYNFISGQSIKTSDGQISINDHPLGRDYCILLMAKKFVSQGDTAISSNPLAAFPVASVIVSLWKLMPDFGQIFLAYTYKESPFLVPYFIPQKRNQQIKEYYKVLGYRVSADGQVEQQDMYLKRQAGIVRLYSAVMITSGRHADANLPHPYSIEHGWRWLTNFVSLEPLPDICATLILEFLQVVGTDMWRVFGKQFVKLLIYIQQQYFPKLSAVDEGGPKARLALQLTKILQEGQITQTKGILPAGFW